MTRGTKLIIGVFTASSAILCACGGGQPPEAEEPAASTAEAPEAEPPSAAENMQSHFADVAAARDAVVQGEVEGVRESLARIAAAEYGADLPGDWQDWVGEMQESARGHSAVSELRAAASAVAELTDQCADCHRTTLGGPAVPDVEVPEYTGDVAGSMARHAWGTEQLWLGLTAPSHLAWSRGAAAIAEDTMVAEGEEELNEAIAPHLEDVRALANACADAASPAQKTDAYAELISRCATCHAGLDGR